MKSFRIKTLLAGALTLALIIFAALYIVDKHSRVRPASLPAFAAARHKKVIIDAGHGGLDGGAVSKSGTSEAAINLAISLKTGALMQFLGLETVLTRETERSLDYDPGASVRDNKNADLRARYIISTENPQSDFLSIHLNKFEQSSVRGAQVFYSPNREESLALANALQEKLVSTLDPGNHRRAKMSQGDVYLMKTIHSPAVTIECGFLSNSEEEALLQTEAYQTKLAIAITAGYVDYLAAEHGSVE